MLRVFSDSCLSLDHMETVTRADLIRQNHILGPGVDYFTQDGKPVKPHPGMEELQRVFSGSTLDLNALGSGGELSAASQSPREEEWNVSVHASSGSPSGAPLSAFFFQQHLLSLPESVISSPCASTCNEWNTGKGMGNSDIVMVIGDNVYIATSVVAKLLSVGYSVRVTVSDSAKAPHYESSFYTLQYDIAQRLAVFIADMTDEEALSCAMKGCQYVVHCGYSNITSSSSLPSDVEHTQMFLDASVSGRNLVSASTHAVSDDEENKYYSIQYSERAVKALFAAIRKVGASTIKRVIITGAYTSVFDVADADPASGLFDENCWNTKTSPEDDPAVFAKILFEKEAWRLQRMIGVEMVVLLPAVPIGLSCTAETGECMQIIQDLATTKFPFCPDLCWNFVDVQDVAECHLRALQNPDLRQGRIIISTACLSLVELSGLLKEVRPSLSPPVKTLNKLLSFFAFQLNVSRFRRRKRLWRSLGKRKVLDNCKAKRVLGMEFTPLEKALDECLERILTSSSSNSDREQTSQTVPRKTSSPWVCNSFITSVRVVSGLSIIGAVSAIFFASRRLQR